MEKYQEIERSIIKRFRKDIWAKFVKAVAEYELIKENDKIMVCISGGKDSFLLAKCMEEIQKHGKFPFDVHYVCMNPGYNEKNKELIQEAINKNPEFGHLEGDFLYIPASWTNVMSFVLYFIYTTYIFVFILVSIYLFSFLNFEP